MSSSEDDFNEDNITKILEAADTNFLSKDFYKNSLNIKNSLPISKENCEQNNSDDEHVQKSNDVLKDADLKCLPSQRYLYEEDLGFDHVKISETMQKFVGKKLSNMVQSQIEFSELTYDKKILKKLLKPNNGLKLLRDCDIDINVENQEIETNFPIKKPLIIKRKIEADTDDKLSHFEKIKMAIIEPDHIINKADIKYWKDRKKSKVYRYKSKSGPPFQFIEPENEFTLLRRKNNWSFKNISRQHKKSQNGS